MRLKAPGLERPRSVDPEFFEQPLPDRRLLLIECRGIDHGKPAKDGERGDFRLGRKPACNRGQMRIAFRGHAHPRLVFSRGLAMRRPDFGCRGAERFRKHTRRDLCRRGRRYGKSAPANPIAALGLTWSYLGEQPYRAKAAAAIAARRTALAALLSGLLWLSAPFGFGSACGVGPDRRR